MKTLHFKGKDARDVVRALSGRAPLPTVAELCDKPRGELADFVGATLGTAEVQQYETDASALAQRAAYLSFYLMARGAAGCGDNGHDSAIAYAQRRMKAVRKALGYTQP